MTEAASIFYSMITIVPFIVWLCMKYVGADKRLVSVISIYGYSLAVFVPAALICAAPAEWLRWLTILISCGMSTTFLVRNLWTLMESDDGMSRTVKQKQNSYFLITFVVAAQVIVALLLKWWFY